MSHRRPVSEEALERSLRVITEEYVALTRIMTEDEYILETTDPRARRVTPHQVLRLVESSGYQEAIMEDTAVRRGFRGSVNRVSRRRFYARGTKLDNELVQWNLR